MNRKRDGVTETDEDALKPPTAAWIVASPAPCAATRPEPSTVASDASLELQSTLPERSAMLLSE